MPTSQLIGRPSRLAARTMSTPSRDDRRHRCTRAPVARISSTMVAMAMVSANDGDPRQSQARRHLAVVGDAVLGQIAVLRAQPDAETEGGRVLHCAQQHLIVLQRHIGLGESDAAGVAQFRHFRELLAGQANGERADRINVRQVKRLGAMLEHFHQAGLVQRRIGVGRTGEAGDAARRRGQHFRFQRRLVFVAGFAQARRQVDQARADHQAGGVEHAVGIEAGRRLAHGGDLAGGDKQVRLRVDVVAPGRSAGRS